MSFIHTFWTTNFPFFNDVQFIYYFLDLATIMTFVDCILLVPIMLLRPRQIVASRRELWLLILQNFL